MAQFQYINRNGDQKIGEVSVDTYAEAARHKMSMSGYLNLKYADADVERHGTAFQQGQMSSGIYTKAHPEYGIMQSSNIGEILDGSVLEARMAGEGLSGGGGIVAPSTQGTTPASRVFFPETVLSFLNEILQGDDYALEQRIWNAMIGNKETIPTEMFTQPLINTEAPKAEDSAPMSQNALPKTLVSITTSQYSKSIVTMSVGLQISDQAVAHSSLDLVGIILRQQAAGEALRLMWRDISAVVAGNVDAGQSALPVAGFKATYDSAAAANSVTQKGWRKYLYIPDNSATIDSIICTNDTFDQIENRTGRPVIFDPNTTGSNVGNLGSYGRNVEPNLLNYSIGVPNVMLVPDGVVAANLIVGFDSGSALRKVTNASASYSAAEKMILQRSNFMRMDWGNLTYRLFDSAFRLTDTTNA